MLRASALRGTDERPDLGNNTFLVRVFQARDLRLGTVDLTLVRLAIRRYTIVAMIQRFGTRTSYFKAFDKVSSHINQVC